jgi:hypothetical protein
LNVTLEKIFEVLDTNDGFSQQGIVKQTDGSLLFGYGSGAEPGVNIWYRSTDDGASWTARSTHNVAEVQAISTPAHGKTNVAIYPSYEHSFVRAMLNRSSNSGASWTTTGDFPSAASNAQSCWTVCVCAIDNGDRYIAGGQFQGSNSFPSEYIAVSNNAGLSWTPQQAMDIGDPGTYCSAIANAGEGRLYAATRFWDSGQGFPRAYRSDDAGENWTDLGFLPVPTGSNGGVVYTITAPQRDLVCMAGGGGGPGNNGKPYVWFSSNSGGSFTLLTASDIAGWAAGASYTQRNRELKRITRDLVLLGSENMDSGSEPFCAFSLNSGASYDIEPDTPVGGWPDWTAAVGNSVTNTTGKILIPVIRWPDFGEMYQQIWRATVHC